LDQSDLSLAPPHIGFLREFVELVEVDSIDSKGRQYLNLFPGTTPNASSFHRTDASHDDGDEAETKRDHPVVKGTKGKAKRKRMDVEV